MQQLTRTVLATTTVLLALMWSSAVHADQWNDKTILKFSEPVMVPGATLQPGTYVFKLPDSGASSRHVVRIYTENEERLVTTVQAIPMKRLNPTNDIAIRFSATDESSPPALKGWFYPGSTYGHQFIYSDEEAKQIAGRTKTVVLAGDQADSDMSSASLHVYDAAGIRASWKPDEATEREWQAWQAGRKASGVSANSGGQQEQSANAATVNAAFEGKRVKLDALEDQPQSYMGQRISVDGEVDQVLGPRLFTLDEPDWIDLEGELLVYMPAPLAAFVRDNDRVTVSGTVKTFVKTDIEREWGWLTLSPETEVEFSKKPVIVADRVIGGDSKRAMMIAAGSGTGDRAVGTSGTSSSNTSAPITTAASLATADDEMVGRSVDLDGVKVTGLADQGGFFVASKDRQLFVLPEGSKTGQVSVGQTISIEGTVMQMPHRMRDRIKAPDAMNRHVYIFAENVSTK
ncbi:MAG: hypothetical protein AB7N65_13525 [Vicinamibacterales bacterium]